MARYKRGGFIFDCWKGDHPPKHFHIFNSKGEFLGRYDIENMKPIGNWIPSNRLIKFIKEIVKEKELL